MICSIGIVENIYLLLVVQDFNDYDNGSYFPSFWYDEYLLLIDMDGKIICEKNQTLEIYTQANASFFGELFLCDGEETYYADLQEMYRITSSMKKDVIEKSEYGCEIATITDDKIYYTSSTGSQFAAVEIKYVRCYDKLSGERYDTGIDLYFNNYKMLGVLTVIDEMIYAVYTNIPLESDGGEEWLDPDYYRSRAEKNFPESEGYYFYLYRYNMETGEYTLVAQ